MRAKHTDHLFEVMFWKLLGLRRRVQVKLVDQLLDLLVRQA